MGLPFGFCALQSPTFRHKGFFEPLVFTEDEKTVLVLKFLHPHLHGVCDSSSSPLAESNPFHVLQHLLHRNHRHHPRCWWNRERRNRGREGSILNFVCAPFGRFFDRSEDSSCVANDAADHLGGGQHCIPTWCQPRRAPRSAKSRHREGGVFHSRVCEPQKGGNTPRAARL